MLLLPETPRIYLPRKRYLEIPFSTEVKVANKIRIQSTFNGVTRWLTPWFSNHITNAGMNAIATNTRRYDNCVLGPDTTEPTDTISVLPGTVTIQNSGSITSTTSNGSEVVGSETLYYGEQYLIYSFAQYTGAPVNLGCIGFGDIITNPIVTLTAYERIRDAQGVGTTFPLQTGETLTVHYRHRVYVSITDLTASLNVTDHGTSRAFTVTTRPSGVTAFSMGGVSSIYTLGTAVSSGSSLNSADLVLATAARPSGTTPNTAVSAVYVADTYRRNGTLTWNAGTYTGNVFRVIWAIGQASNGSTMSAQSRLQPDTGSILAKSANDQAIIEHTTSWSRLSA